MQNWEAITKDAVCLTDDLLDDTDGYGLTHISDGKTTKKSVDAVCHQEMISVLHETNYE